jgi:hypothetical protein
MKKYFTKKDTSFFFIYLLYMRYKPKKPIKKKRLPIEKPHLEKPPSKDLVKPPTQNLNGEGRFHILPYTKSA